MSFDCDAAHTRSQLPPPPRPTPRRPPPRRRSALVRAGPRRHRTARHVRQRVHAEAQERPVRQTRHSVSALITYRRAGRRCAIYSARGASGSVARPRQASESTCCGLRRIAREGRWPHREHAVGSFQQLLQPAPAHQWVAPDLEKLQMLRAATVHHSVHGIALHGVPHATLCIQACTEQSMRTAQRHMLPQRVHCTAHAAHAGLQPHLVREHCRRQPRHCAVADCIGAEQQLAHLQGERLCRRNSASGSGQARRSMQVGPRRSLRTRSRTAAYRRRGAEQVGERERARIADRVVLQLDALDLHNTAAAVSKPKRCVFAAALARSREATACDATARRAATGRRCAAQHSKAAGSCGVSVLGRCNGRRSGRTREFAAQAIATCRAPARLIARSSSVAWNVAGCD